MYDIAIIGGGPAGVSAAITAKVKNKNFIWFASKAVSDKVAKAELIKNYPGLPSVTGAELGWTFGNHCDSLGIDGRLRYWRQIYFTCWSKGLRSKDCNTLPGSSRLKGVRGRGKISRSRGELLRHVRRKPV